MNIGIIAEDDSDAAVVREIVLPLLRPHRVGFKRFVGGGSGRLRCKCAAWARSLVDRGCAWIVVVHDLDINEERAIRDHLENAVATANPRASVVLIPKREIEAWLLYDGAAIAAVFGRAGRLRLPGDPESLADPKRHLGDLIWRSYGQYYLNTVHNARIAKQIRVASLRRCASFSPLPPFAQMVRGMLSQSSLLRSN